LRRYDEWSDDEIAVLHQAHKDGKSHAECLELFPSRSLKAISNKRNRLGLLIKGPNKQSEDARRVCELVLNGLTVRQIRTELPHLYYDNIYAFARQRRLAVPSSVGRPFKRTLFSLDEDNVLLEAMSNQQTAGAVAGHSAFASKPVSVLAIEVRMKKLRLYGSALYGTRTAEPWEDKEDKLLIEMYEEGVEHKDIGLRLDRFYFAVGNRIRRLRKQGNIGSCTETE